MLMSSIARPVASSASFLGHCSAASASALHRVLGARVHEYFVTGGTKVRRYMEETNQEIRPSTYLLTYILTCVLLTYFLLIFYLLTYFLLNMSLDCIDLVCHIIKC